MTTMINKQQREIERCITQFFGINKLSFNSSMDEYEKVYKCFKILNDEYGYTTFETFMSIADKFIDKQYLPPTDAQNSTLYLNALTEKYPEMISTLEDLTKYKPYEDVRAFNADDECNFCPVVKFGVFGVGDRRLTIPTEHIMFRDEFEVRKIELLIYDNYVNECCPKLAYYRDTCKAIKPIHEIITSIQSCQTVNELYKLTDLLTDMLMDSKIWLSLGLATFGGLCWSDENEAHHVVELLDLYYRIHNAHDDELDNEYKLVEPTVNDYMLFKTNPQPIHDAKYFPKFQVFGINLTLLEVIHKWYELTNKNIFPTWINDAINVVWFNMSDE